MQTYGSAAWQGGIKDGKGAISTKSGALKDYPYGFASRFEGKPGTNPEELIGAAHAGCFTMALSLILGEAKLTAERMDTTAESYTRKGGRRLCHHRGRPNTKGQGTRRGSGKIRRACSQGQSRMSGFQVAECQDYSGGHSG